MREVKFRAWEKENKIMWFDVAVGNGKILQTIDIDSNPELVEDMFIIMQFTGLHDKNGKEIYEGDIVKSPKKEYEVVWNNECARWGLLDGVNYPVAIHHEGNTLEVIGNIYENPEILN